MIFKSIRCVQSLLTGGSNVQFLVNTGARALSSASERDTLPFDVCIVGAGPAGLSAAIRLKQLAKQADRDVTVAVLEKGSEVGTQDLH